MTGCAKTRPPGRAPGVEVWRKLRKNKRLKLAVAHSNGLHAERMVMPAPAPGKHICRKKASCERSGSQRASNQNNSLATAADHDDKRPVSEFLPANACFFANAFL